MREGQLGLTTAVSGLDANGFYIYNSTQNQTINFFYIRDQYDLTFDVNYPVDANLVYPYGKSSNLTVDDIYYQYPLTEYGSSQTNGKTNWYYGVVDDNNTAQHELVGPDHYIFGGWYEDASCTVPFNFDSTMPVGNKIVYAKWEPEWFVMHIDPNGAEIDHVNHANEFSRDAIPGERPADTGYDPSQSTYFWLSYGGVISEYSLARNYVPISEAAAEQYDGQIYYYMNHQYSKDLDGDYGLNANARNALYLTEEEIDRYYQHYADYAARAGVTVLDSDTWRQHYTSYGRKKYRIANGQEHYEFLGWYQVFNAGTEDEYLGDMPYVFTTPISNDLYLRAMWRLDGGYMIQYVPEYTMPDGAIINGEMENWNDPPTGNLSYSDGAATEIYKQPTDLTKNGISIDDDSVIFLGWQLVSKSGTDDNPVYIPLEPGTYYDPSDPYTVNAANADTDSIIYFQAVYQYREASDRRPLVKNLTLDANTGYINTNDSADLPEWEYYPGTSAINTEDHLFGTDPTRIEFGDIQSSAAVHLYRYATELTEDASGNAVTDANQFFEHPDGYFLLGFDDGPTEGDYIAAYPADSVIAITRDEDRTIYAVWEPMVYLTLNNETGVGDVTFNISSSSTEALEVINVKNGIYDRQPLSNLNNITLADGESITLAFPKGAEKNITISGTNTLGIGKVLVWNSSVDLVEDNITTHYGTNGEDETYSHLSHEHTLVSGETGNTKPFSFDETLITNENPVTVTFTSRNNEYALVLKDNWNGDGTGGGTQEYDFGLDDIQPENGVPKSQGLPTTSTRIGYSFIGWATSLEHAAAGVADYSAASPAGSPWTIPDLNKDDGFFKSDETVIINDVITRTLYAVWEASTDAIYIYKDVPAPGSQEQAFDFTVKITGTYQFGNGGSSTEVINKSSTFRIAHGEYLRIKTTKNTGTETSPAFIQSDVQVFTSATDEITGVTSYQEDTTRSGSIRWSKEVARNASNGFRDDLKITVTEGVAAYYGTEIELSSETKDNEITVGGRTYAESELPQTVETNEFYWKNTDAGGTVVYTNTRQTHDIGISKILHSNTSAAGIFSFTASYTLDDGDPVDLGTFTVQSGTVNTEALENIPAGAILTITEVKDANDNYITTAVSQKSAVDLDTQNSKIFKFAVSEDDTITFDNTLKSYPVTFRLVDQDGNTSINGMFSLSSSIGSLGTDLYASAASTNPPAGQFYKSDTFWADTYTLAQTVIPTNYIGPGGPVTLTVTGSGIVSSDPENVTVTWKDPDDHSQGYLITVINRATKKVTIKKVLEDPLLANTRQFGFNYSYIPQDSEGHATGETVTGDFSLLPVSNDTNGVTYELAVPIYANLTVSEKTTDDYASVGETYSTSVTSTDFTDSSEDDDIVFAVDMVEADGTITFTNTRKTREVTVKKLFEDENDTISVPFTTSVLNGSTAITSYTVFGTTGEAGALTTDANGQVTFNLVHNGTQVLTVPYGAKVIISEEAEGYTAAITTEHETADEDSTENCFTMTVTQDDTVTFTNRKSGVHVILKKIGLDSATQQINSEHLGGAEFTIYKEDHLTVAEGKVEEGGETTSKSLRALTSSNDSGIFFDGALLAGTYYLHETGSPDGYYKLVDDLRMTVSSDGKVEIFGQSGSETEEFAAIDGVSTVAVKNYSGYALPSTGGSGTALIHILGLLLTGLAGIGLLLKISRKNSQNCHMEKS